MESTQVKPFRGSSLACAEVEQREIRRRHKAGGYVSAQILEALNAYCWSRRTTQSKFVASLVVAELESLEDLGELTPKIIREYRAAKR